MMKRFLAPVCIAAILALQTPPVAMAAQASEAGAKANSPFDRRAGQLVDLLRGRIAFADYFAPSFQEAVPEARFRAMMANLIEQHGEPVAIERMTSRNGRSGTILLRFEKGMGQLTLDVDAAPDERVAGLQLTSFTMESDSYDRIAAELTALPGQTGFLVAKLEGATHRPLAAANDDRQFAIGSTFKLYILNELAAQIATGKRRWDEVVPLAYPSFSSVGTANWPKNTPVTVQSLANWMISVSDNSAADTLIHLLGRDAIEARMRAAGHSDPSRNIPFLTTVEAFALKGNNFSDLRPAFIAGNDRAQRRLIDTHRDRFTLANVDGISFVDGPRFIESLEWFASPNDIARAMADLRARESDTAMAALAINNGVGPVAAADWRYLGYKGGSENGVLSMSLLGQRKLDGRWIVVTASWNNGKENIATDKLVGLVTRLLALAAK